MRLAEVEGQKGYYDETTEEFHPEGALKRAEVEGRTGLYNPDTEDFYPMAFEAEAPAEPTPFQKPVGTGPQGRMTEQEVAGMFGSAAEPVEAAGRGLRAGVSDAMGQVGSAMRFAAAPPDELTRHQRSTVKMRVAGGEREEDVIKSLRTQAEPIRKLGDFTHDYWDKVADKYGPDADIQGSLAENPGLLKSPKWWTYNISRMAPSQVATVLAGLVAGPGAAGFVGGAQEGLSEYETARKMGLPEEQAKATGAIMAGGSSALNAVSFAKAVKQVPGLKAKVLNYIEAAGLEPLTEWLEEPWGAVSRGIAEGKIDPEAVKQAAVQGIDVIPTTFALGLMQLPAGAAFAAKNAPVKSRTEQAAEKRYGAPTVPRGTPENEPDWKALGIAPEQALTPEETPSTTPQPAVHGLKPIEPSHEPPISVEQAMRESPESAVRVAKLLQKKQAETEAARKPTIPIPAEEVMGQHFDSKTGRWDLTEAERGIINDLTSGLEASKSEPMISSEGHRLRATISDIKLSAPWYMSSWGTKEQVAKKLRDIAAGKGDRLDFQTWKPRLENMLSEYERNITDVQSLDLENGDTIIKPRNTDGRIDKFKVEVAGDKIKLKDGVTEEYTADFGKTIPVLDVQKGETFSNPAAEYLDSLPEAERQRIIDEADKQELVASRYMENMKIGPYAESFTLTPAEETIKRTKLKQDGMDLGLTGKDLRAPEREGRAVSMDELELGKATNEAADRAKQEPLSLTEKLKAKYRASNISREGGGVGEKSIAPTFYSKLQKTIEKAMPNRATADVVRSIIKDVKADEIKWSDIDTFLAEHKGMVDKKELLDHLRANQVEIKEVVKGGKIIRPREIEQRFKDAGLDIGVANERGEDQTLVFRADDDERIPLDREDIPTDLLPLFDEYDSIKAEYGDTATDTKFQQYQLPGGSNYREMLLTLPEKPTDANIKPVWKQNAKGLWAFFRGDRQISGAFPDENSKTVAQTTISSEARMDKENYRSPHWDEPNVLAHVRMSDRWTSADGTSYTPPQKVLFIEEVQSDWHQEGKRKGYAEELKPGELPAGYKVKDVSKEGWKEWGVYSDDHGIPTQWASGPTKEDAIKSFQEILRGGFISRVPVAPFSKSWPLLAMKRMIRYAAENGYDRIAWTTGQVHTDRWGTEQIAWDKQADGSFLVSAKSQHGGQAGGIDLEAEGAARGLTKQNSATIDSQQSLEDAIRLALTEGQDAKKLAEKLWKRMQDEAQGVSHPRKEGFEGFYDQILPAEVNKYVKKWGARVGEITLPKEKEYKADTQRSMTVPSIDLTPSMKSAAMYEGQELYTFPSMLTPSLIGKSVKAIAADMKETPAGKMVGNALKQAGLIKDPRVRDRVEKDLTWLQRNIHTPHYVGSIHKEIANIIDRAEAITRERDNLISQTLVFERPYFELDAASRKKIDLANEVGTLKKKEWDDDQLKRGFKLNEAEISAYKGMQEKYKHVLGELKKLGLELGLTEEEINEMYQGLTGYIPLTRFGEWAVSLRGDKGKAISFDMFESEREAWAYANKEVAKDPALDVEVKRIPKGGHEDVLGGLDPATLSLFVKIADINPEIADPFLIQAKEFFKGKGFKKHFFHRGETPGYSKDWQRVHADYTVGVANYISRLRGIRDMREMMKDVPKSKPDLVKYAGAYIDYLQNPGPEAAKLRSALFIYYLGMNTKSAVLNLTQSATTTIPWLSQYSKGAGIKVGKVAADIVAAVKFKDGRPYFDYESLGDEGLITALKEAEGSGVVTEQQIYELMAKSRGEFLTKEKHNVARAMMYMFGTAETFNRRVAFVSAYRIGQELEAAGKLQKQFESVQDFAEKTVKESQFRYGRWNRPPIGRGRIGATFFTFKNFQLQYIEMLSKLAKANGEAINKGAFGKALGIMFLLAGAAGIPFADDLKKAIEAITGENLDTLARDKAVDLFGDPAIGELFMRGITRFGPYDMSGAVGLGDMVPEVDTVSILGPAGGVVQGVTKAIPYANKGEYGRALELVAPKFMAGPMQAGRMVKEGMRGKGGNLIFSGEGRWPLWANAGGKAFGFQPSDLSRAYEREHAQAMIGGKRAKYKSDFVYQAAKAIANGNQQEAAKVREKVAAYNKGKEPQEKIVITNNDIEARIRIMKMGEDMTGLKSAPKQSRGEYQRLNKLFQ